MYYKALRTYPELKFPPSFISGGPTDATQQISYHINGDVDGSGSSKQNSSSESSEEVSVDRKDINSLPYDKTKISQPIKVADADESSSLSATSNNFLKAIYVPYVNAVPEILRMNPKALAMTIAVIMTVMSLATILMNIVFLAIGINLVG